MGHLKLQEFLPLFKNKLSYIPYPLLLLSIVFLTSCNPDFYVNKIWQYSVFHFEQNQGTCSGNLKLKVSTEGTLMFESPDVKIADSFSDYLDIPSTLHFNSPMKIEAWCLDLEGQELGYFLFENPLTGSRGRKGSAIVLSDLKVTVGCLKATGSRGIELCVSSKLFEGLDL